MAIFRNENHSENYNEEKEHYKSLREYFEGLFSKTLWAIGIIITVAGYFTYSSFNDLIEKAKKEVEDTKAQALKEIEKIKVESKAIAHQEAVKKIQEVFKTNNIEPLIIEAAKQYIEPEIKNVIDKKDIERNDKIIELLKSPDQTDKLEAASSLTSDISNKLTESQIGKLIETLKTDDKDEKYRPSIVSVLTLYKSKQVEEYFIHLLNNESHSPYILQLACVYLTKPEHEPSIEVFENALKRKRKFNENGTELYSEFISQAIENNSKLVFKLLNSKEIVDFLYNGNKEILFNTKTNLLQQLKTKFSEEEINSTYLFRKSSK